MPDLGRYEKVPRPESIQKLIEYLSSNSKVSAVNHSGGQLLTINRSRLSNTYQAPGRQEVKFTAYEKD
jgi:hypothetical protein